MLVLIINTTRRFTEIDLHDGGAESLRITLHATEGSFTVSEDGEISANQTPIVVTLEDENLSHLISPISHDLLAYMKKQALEQLNQYRKKRREIKPYRLAAEVVSKEAPSLKGREFQRVVDNLRKFIMERMTKKDPR